MDLTNMCGLANTTTAHGLHRDNLTQISVRTGHSVIIIFIVMENRKVLLRAR